MINRNIILLLSILLLLNQVCVNATHDYVPRYTDIERSSKNILVGSYVGGRSHLKPILDVATILAERGHNVSNKKFRVLYDFPNHLQIYLLSRHFILICRSHY
jgi:hypothetical protein